MTKSQLIDAVAASCGLKRASAARFVECTFDTMKGALAEREKVQISGFGTFTPKSRVSRKGRDPKTGKIKRPEAIMPSDWLRSFGLTVDEHTASTQIDLADGFVAPEITVSDDTPAQQPNSAPNDGGI